MKRRKKSVAEDTSASGEACTPLHPPALSLPSLPQHWKGYNSKQRVQNTIRDWRNVVGHYKKYCHTTHSQPLPVCPLHGSRLSLCLRSEKWGSTVEEKTCQWQTSISPSTARKKSCLPPTPVCLFCPLRITYTPSRSFFFSCKKTPGNRGLGKKNIEKTKITILDKQYFHCPQWTNDAQHCYRSFWPKLHIFPLIAPVKKKSSQILNSNRSCTYSNACIPGIRSTVTRRTHKFILSSTVTTEHKTQ